MPNIFESISPFYQAHKATHNGFELEARVMDDENPDLSYLGEFSDKPAAKFSIKCKSMGNIPHYKYFNAENVKNDEQALENYKRALDYGNGWSCVGVVVHVHKAGVKLATTSLWGIESDSGQDYLTGCANDLAHDALSEAEAKLIELASN